MGIYIIFLSWGNSLGPLIAGFLTSGMNSYKDFTSITKCIPGVGWQYFLWLSTALTGFNFLTVILFVPETRFVRDIDCSMVGVENMIAESSKEQAVPVQIERAHPQTRSAEATTGVRRTWAQQLNPWSGVDNTTSFIELFLRPFPLIAYPAVIWAILGCRKHLYLCIFDYHTDVLQTLYHWHGLSPSALSILLFFKHHHIASALE